MWNALRWCRARPLLALTGVIAVLLAASGVTFALLTRSPLPDDVAAGPPIALSDAVVAAVAPGCEDQPCEVLDRRDGYEVPGGPALVALVRAQPASQTPIDRLVVISKAAEVLASAPSGTADGLVPEGALRTDVTGNVLVVFDGRPGAERPVATAQAIRLRPDGVTVLPPLTGDHAWLLNRGRDRPLDIETSAVVGDFSTGPAVRTTYRWNNERYAPLRCVVSRRGSQPSDVPPPSGLTKCTTEGE